MQSAVIFLLCVPAIYALRCYDYQRATQYPNNMHSWVECSYDARFCFKTYTESVDNFGQKLFVETRNCGTPNVCQREGCMGNSRDQSCCCTGDLCNSAESKMSIPMIITTAAAAYFLH